MSSSGEQPVRVLYVGTSESFAERIGDALAGSRGERVQTAPAAVHAVDAGSVDCAVVGEIDLEDSVLELIESLRERQPGLPAVLVAEGGNDERARAAATAGAAYIPTNPEREDTTLVADRVRALVDREREYRAAKRASDHLESLFESSPLPVVELAPDGEVLRWNHGAKETFGWTGEEVVGAFNPIVPESEMEEFEQGMDRLLAGEEMRGVEVVARTKDGDRLEFLLSAAPVPGPGGEPQSITAVLNEITAQKRIEHRLRRLQETARRLSVSPSIDEIGDIATAAAADVLGLEITGLWRYDEHEHTLRPVAVTEEGKAQFPSVPTFAPGNSLAWEVFEEGEVRSFEDLRNVSGRHNPDTEVRSEIIVPLDSQGVLVTGSTEPRQFTDTDIDLFRILGATVEAALLRASREQQLRRQNERLEQFADVVAHDLRNPLTTARGFLDLARESGDADQFERVEAAHDRIGQLIEDLLTLARGDTTVTDGEAVAVGETAAVAWKLVETENLTLDVREPPTVTGDPGRLRQLFENLFRNTVEHGDSSPPGESDRKVEGPKTVTVGALEDGGFYVTDDGVGIPEAYRGEVLEHGVTFSDDGTGFGLSIVADIARAHGWAISVSPGEDGGARFEFRPEDRQSNA